MSVFYLTQALGGYIGAAIVAFINALTNPNWINEDVNRSQLGPYFFVLCGLGILNFFLYAFVSSNYKVQNYRTNNQTDDKGRPLRQDDGAVVRLDD